MSSADRAKELRAAANLTRTGDDGIEREEHKMLGQILDALTKIAKEDDLTSYKSPLQTVLKQLLAATGTKTAQGKKP